MKLKGYDQKENSKPCFNINNSKKRHIKELTKSHGQSFPKSQHDNSERRRSSRLEKLDDNDPNRSKYTVDKLRQNQFRE